MPDLVRLPCPFLPRRSSPWSSDHPFPMDGSFPNTPPQLILILSLWLLTSTMGVRPNGASAAPPRLPHGAPAEVGLRAERLAWIDQVVQEGLDNQRMPGCVIAVGRHGKLVFLKAYGNRQTVPEPLPMTVDTVFDMASITKPVATATSVMMLVEQGKLRLRDRVSDYFADFAENGKQDITLTQLLIHQGGLIPDNAIGDYDHGTEEAWRRILALPTHVEPGTKFVYTDVGFIVLGELIRHASGLDVHQFSQQHLFGPLGMTETRYLPNEALKARCAPTEQRDDRWIQGEVHDPRAFRLEGIAGHAGMFSTAEDLAVYAQMMLQGGSYGGVRILSPATVALMTQAYQVDERNVRGLGWDKLSVYSSNRGENFSPSAFGHGGFTGTVLWIDPELDLFFIFLSNRVHPDGKGNVNSLAGRIATIVGGAIDPNLGDATDATDRSTFQRSLPAVQTGLDCLQADGFELLRGQRVGLITNHTGINRQGVSNIALLDADPNVQLVALFSPEHGIAGKLDVEKIGDSQDDATGLKVFSLYGESRQPSSEQLAEIDTLVFDIQDIGTRFYTYISTMGLAMEAAETHGKRFVVLDRPNVIDGRTVAGPVLDAGQESFVGFHTLPVRHGMTAGELATMFQRERYPELDLHIVRVQNWDRDWYFDQTGLPWVDPSPNMRNVNQAILYPGIGLLETTNVSVGRGTDTPFERFGAPWINANDLAATLNRAALPGVRFTPIRFTPDSSVFANESCQGVQILITDRDAVDPLSVGFEIASTLRRMYPTEWQHARYRRLLADAAVWDAVDGARGRHEIMALYREELQSFLERRAACLLYE